jgi:hypothetical protein
MCVGETTTLMRIWFGRRDMSDILLDHTASVLIFVRVPKWADTICWSFRGGIIHRCKAWCSSMVVEPEAERECHIHSCLFNYFTSAHNSTIDQTLAPCEWIHYHFFAKSLIFFEFGRSDCLTNTVIEAWNTRQNFRRWTSFCFVKFWSRLFWLLQMSRSWLWQLDICIHALCRLLAASGAGVWMRMASWESEIQQARLMLLRYILGKVGRIMSFHAFFRLYVPPTPPPVPFLLALLCAPNLNTPGPKFRPICTRDAY